MPVNPLQLTPLLSQLMRDRVKPENKAALKESNDVPFGGLL